MRPEELKKCLKILGLSPMQLQKLLLIQDLKKISQMEARCVRAMVLKPEVRDLVYAWRDAFPALTFTWIGEAKNDDQP